MMIMVSITNFRINQNDKNIIWLSSLQSSYTVSNTCFFSNIIFFLLQNRSFISFASLLLAINYRLIVVSIEIILCVSDTIQINHNWWSHSFTVVPDKKNIRVTLPGAITILTIFEQFTMCITCKKTVSITSTAKYENSALWIFISRCQCKPLCEFQVLYKLIVKNKYLVCLKWLISTRLHLLPPLKLFIIPFGHCSPRTS